MTGSEEISGISALKPRGSGLFKCTRVTSFFKTRKGTLPSYWECLTLNRQMICSTDTPRQPKATHLGWQHEISCVGVRPCVVTGCSREPFRQNTVRCQWKEMCCRRDQAGAQKLRITVFANANHRRQRGVLVERWLRIRILRFWTRSASCQMRCVERSEADKSIGIGEYRLA